MELPDKNQGRFNHMYTDGANKVFINADPAATGQDPDLGKSTGKLTGAILEAFGGNGEQLKRERLYRNHTAGTITPKSDEGVWEVGAS